MLASPVKAASVSISNEGRLKSGSHFRPDSNAGEMFGSRAIYVQFSDLSVIPDVTKVGKIDHARERQALSQGEIE